MVWLLQLLDSSSSDSRSRSGRTIYPPPSPDMSRETSVQPVAPTPETVSPTSLAIIPAPISQPVFLRAVPSLPVEYARFVSTAVSVTSPVSWGPAPIPYYVHSVLVGGREYLLEQNRVLLRLLAARQAEPDTSTFPSASVFPSVPTPASLCYFSSTSSTRYLRTTGYPRRASYDLFCWLASTNLITKWMCSTCIVVMCVYE